MRKSEYAMAMQPTRGNLNDGLTFGYVDVPETITEENRPFLNELTAASLALQKEIRAGKKIEIQIEDVRIPCAYGDMDARIYIPDGNGPFPLVMNYHGGGFAIRDIECFDFLSRYYAKNGNAVVVTIDYALAPEKRFPVQAEQSYSALLWAREHAREYKADPLRDIVTGDSAGGNLSAVVSMMCRDRGIRVPKRQILAYPVVDARPEIMRASYEIYGEHYNLDYKHLLSYNKAYIENISDYENPYVSPLLANEMDGMPDTKVILAECDILIDQGLEYIERLNQAGVPVEYHIFKGVPHDFLFYGFNESYDAYKMICDWINE